MRRLYLFLIAAGLAANAGAQTSAPFLIRTVQGNNTQTLSDGGTMNLPADGIGIASNGFITVSYTNTATGAQAQITQITQSGSSDFSFPDYAGGSITLTPDAPSANFRVQFLPSTSRLTTGKIVFSYVDGTRSGTFSLNLSGTAPEFGATYAVQPSGNTSLLNNGDTIGMPATALRQTSSVLVTLTNRGSGSGAVTSVGYSGSPKFALAGVPLLPASVDAGKSLAFSVQFTPDDLPQVTGAVQVSLAGRTLAFNVAGSGLGGTLEYVIVKKAGNTPVLPNGTITLPETAVNGTGSSVQVQVTNKGNADVLVSTISVAGTGFALAQAPFTPYTLPAGQLLTFTIQFTPTQAMRYAGTLRVGNDNFNLEGTGLGSNLIYSYSAAGSSNTIPGGGMVVLPAAAVGQSSSITFTVRNDGTAAQDVFSISAAGTGTVFAASGLPALPKHIAAGESVSFTLTFTPTALGASTGTLKIDTQTFTLSGVGNAPAALPGYTFSGASGTVDAALQPSIGLALKSAYGLDLTGTLTLKFTSDVFSNDPAVQFASGGSTIAFTIPAGTTQAIFPSGATQVKLQTGTVAGTISITPTFATAAGGIDLTPAAPQPVTLSIAQSAPKLTSAIVSAKTTTSFTVQVTGYATGRSITQMDFQFTGVAGENIGTTKVSMPVEPSFTAWFQGSASQAYGSQFSASVTFTLAGEIVNKSSISTLVDTIQSVSVTLTNRQGVSSAASVSLK